MNLTNKQNNLKLVIEDDLLNDLGQIGSKHYPNEFGGFLIGKYSSDFKTVYVTNYLLPKRYNGFPSFFERYVDGLTSIFKKIFKEKREYYIGEWHTHPNGSILYSQTDLKAMIGIANCDSVQIANPVLLILSICETGVNKFAFYFYDNQKLTPYE